MKRFIFFALALTVTVSSLAQVRVTDDDKERASKIVSQMTLDEKIDYIGGYHGFHIRAIKRLGLPDVLMSDATVGVRDCNGTNKPSTAYPANILAASTWDRDMMYRFGESVGRDCNARGVNIILGPGVNIYRAPMCGRNFEYLGEDPYLAGESAAQYVKGVQSRRVIATVKHYALNNQEWSRHLTSSDVDERTMMEIYFPAFRKAIQEGGAGALMNSYNLINSVHATENAWLNKTILRDMWGFDGILMSDWGSVYSAFAAANGGLDLEMPNAKWMNKANIKPLIESGVLSEKVIDEKCQHIIQTLIAFGYLDNMPAVEGDLDSDESDATALDIAREGIVLLKNDGVLPLSKKGKVLVVGPASEVSPAGGGSSKVKPIRTVSFIDELASLHGEKNVISLTDSEFYDDVTDDFYADQSMTQKGFTASYYSGLEQSKKLFTTVVEPSPSHSWAQNAPLEGMPKDKFTVQWRGFYKAAADGMLRLRIGGDDGYRLSINGKEYGGDWGKHSLSHKALALDIKAGQTYEIFFEYFDDGNDAISDFKAEVQKTEELKKKLAECSSIIYCPTFAGIEGEGSDRPYEMPTDQALMRAMFESGKPVVVAAFTGGSFDCSEIADKASAFIECWYPGQEGGKALAEIVTGKINPSGKLPVTFESKWEDNPVHDSYYDKSDAAYKRVLYKEGIFVGYRGYDKSGIAPLYPFGYGLSYTTFSYAGLKLTKIGNDKVKVEFDVTNTGKRDGDEISEVYVSDLECSVTRPVKELKGYSRNAIRKGETKHVEVTLNSEAFSFYDVNTKTFKIEDGTFRIMVGGSSVDLPLKAEIDL